MTPSPTGEDDRAAKQVIICADCGHESPLQDDWTVKETDDQRRHECPSCGATVDVRPLPPPRAR